RQETLLILGVITIFQHQLNKLRYIRIFGTRSIGCGNNGLCYFRYKLKLLIGKTCERGRLGLTTRRTPFEKGCDGWSRYDPSHQKSYTLQCFASIHFLKTNLVYKHKFT